jgi:4-alpha-glucanotransferase
LYYDDLVKRWHGPDGNEPWRDVQRLMHFLELDENDPPKQMTDELHHAFVKSLLETPCWLAVFMVTDMLGTSERFNQPGTHGASNWSQRLSGPLSVYANQSPFKQKIAELSELIEETGRIPHSAAGGRRVQSDSQPKGSQ